MPLLLPEMDDGTESDCNAVQFALLRQSVKHASELWFNVEIRRNKLFHNYF